MEMEYRDTSRRGKGIIAVGIVLALAAGMMEALEGERSAQEISWAAREVMESIADVQPLVLLFEDIHWADDGMLDLIDHLAETSGIGLERTAAVSVGALPIGGAHEGKPRLRRRPPQARWPWR